MIRDSLTLARALMCLLVLVPWVAAFYWGRYRDYYPKNSRKRVGWLMVVYLLLFGPFALQIYIYDAIGHISHGDEFTSVLFLVQFAGALAIHFAVVVKRALSERRGSEPSNPTVERDARKNGARPSP